MIKKGGSSHTNMAAGWLTVVPLEEEVRISGPLEAGRQILETRMLWPRFDYRRQKELREPLRQ